MLYIETSTFLGSLQKFEGAAGEFKGALCSRHPLISSPAITYIERSEKEIFRKSSKEKMQSQNLV